MALAELLQSLVADADARTRTLLTDARAQAAAIRAQYAERLAGRRAEALEARTRELEAGSARALDAARREAARAVLEARATALERVRERAEARLAEADGTGPEMAADLAAALEYLGSAPLVVEAPATMLAAVRRAAPDPARMTFVPAMDQRSGLVVRSADGAVSVDVSSKARLARAWPRLAIALASRLEAAE